MEARADVEQLLWDGNTVQITISGYSMYPMLVPGRDSVILAPLNGVQPKRGDVMLYRRDSSILVLHRVWRVRRDGIYMVGDNQTETEGPLRADQMRGRLEAFIRKGRQIPASSFPYRVYAVLWLWMRPIRHKIAVAVHFMKGCVKRSDGK
ncbi:MAG: hypothetical protein HFH36_04420 [Lachnospiraceae bacterium]|nr:hypothetical protein [Lachnospiraceae bacterium]